MTKKTLIIGGARFHGLKFVEHFAQMGDDVFVLNRGNYKKDYSSNVQHLIADRNDETQLKTVLADHTFDVVIDNNAYNAEQVILLLNCLQRRCKHYIFTSSVAVYLALNTDHKLQEHEADGTEHGFYSPDIKKYALGKLGAEKAIQSFENLNYTIVRLPNIFGEGDFAGKLYYFYKRLKENGKLLLEKEINTFNVISVQDVVNAYAQIIASEACHKAVINVADPHACDYEQFFTVFFGDLYKKENVTLLPAEQLYNEQCTIPFAWGPEMDMDKAGQCLPNFSYTPLENWAKPALDWEIAHPSTKESSEQFTQTRKKELELIQNNDHSHH